LELVKFANQLHETGQVRLSSEPQEIVGMTEAIDALAPHLRMLHEAERHQSPPGLPPLSIGPATWAMLTLYEAARCLVFRELDEPSVRRRLGVPCPQKMSPSTAYSVDLAFRQLPQLLDLARGLSEEDCLVTCLRSLARGWPLSSVGAVKIGPVDTGGFFGNLALRRIYVDRIIETQDITRLVESRVAAAVHEAIGVHGEQLCPTVAEAINFAHVGRQLFDAAVVRGRVRGANV
jgi:hypothetical protein